MSLAERGIDPVYSSVFLENFLRLSQQGPRKIDSPDPELLQFFLDFSIALDNGGFIESVPAHGFCTGFHTDFDQGFQAVSLSNNQVALFFPYLPPERTQTVVQPPITGSSRLPGVFFMGRMNVKQDHLIGVINGMADRWIVAKPEIST